MCRAWCQTAWTDNCEGGDGTQRRRAQLYCKRSGYPSMVLTSTQQMGQEQPNLIPSPAAAAGLGPNQH